MIKKITLEKIVRISPFNVRGETEELYLEEIIESFNSTKTNDVPIILDEKMEVIAGGRRYRAAKKAGVEEVLVDIRKFKNDEEKLGASLRENVSRLDISMEDKHKAVKKLIQAGLSYRDIEKMTGIPKSTANSWYRYYPNVVLDTGRLPSKVSKTGQPIRELISSKSFTQEYKKTTIQLDKNLLLEFKYICRKLNPSQSAEEALETLIGKWIKEKRKEQGWMS